MRGGALRFFTRVAVNEAGIRQRFGGWWREFSKSVLPQKILADGRKFLRYSDWRVVLVFTRQLGDGPMIFLIEGHQSRSIDGSWAIAMTPDSEPQIGSETPDKVLLKRFRRGDEDAATALYLRYAKRLRALAHKQTAGDLGVRLDPDDVVQTVFRTFFRRAAEGHYQIPHGEELWKLFLVIALHKIRDLGDYHRAKKRSTRRTVGLDLSSPVSVTGSDEESFHVLQLTIDDLLEALPESSREIVTQRLQGHEISDIATACGRAKRTVERVLQEFRQQLCDHLAG